MVLDESVGFSKRELLAIEFTKTLILIAGTSYQSEQSDSFIEEGVKLADEMLKRLGR